ncbi:MAG: HNH endonuclease [Pseudonocardiales bacterium]|nr:HNH endonuclease [Pseudonocardiales bacterium]
MTDGTYTGLDDATILQRLRATHGNEDGVDDTAAEGDEDSGAAEGTRAAADDRAQRRPAGRGMELRVRLSTLFGRDEYPAELAGWGPVHAELARKLVTTLGGAQWRFAITDAQGQLLHCGSSRARPAGAPTCMASCRAIVELQIPATTLGDLTSGDPEELGSWGPVITDLDHQYTSAQRSAGDPTRRFPSAALRRHIGIRDRSCVMIGCRAPASSTDTDHTLDHAHGGATVDHNLGTVCRHDHRLKHDGGWQLHQPQPGLFHWISRLGHVYPLHTRPIIEPLPDPIPRPGPAAPLFVRPDGDWEKSTIWDDTPPEADTKPPPESPPEPELHDDPPPF